MTNKQSHYNILRMEDMYSELITLYSMEYTAILFLNRSQDNNSNLPIASSDNSTKGPI
jgi:hypothetical protein